MIDEEALRSIEKLHQLKTDGVITEADFHAAKAKLLAQAPAAKVKATASPPPRFDGTLPDEGNHLAWMLLPLRRYADFKGRSGRREFWMFLLLTNLVAMALGIIALGDTNVFGGTGPIGNLAFALMGIGFLAVLLPFIAVEVRRFHDQGKSGWFALINLVPYVGPFIVLIFMFMPGTEGDNQYGPDPLS